MKKNRVLILGGGFGGSYAALEFQKRRDPDFEVTLISQDNFFLFTPNGTRIKSFTLVWTAGAAPHPLTTGWIG
jgi:NADH dehydrogenase FAD-containing subunit